MPKRMNGIKGLLLLASVIIILSMLIVVLSQHFIVPNPGRDIINIDNMIKNKELNKELNSEDIYNGEYLVGRSYYDGGILVARDELNSIGGPVKRYYYDEHGRKFAAVNFDRCMNPLTTRYYDAEGNKTNEIIPAIQPLCSPSAIW